MDGALVWIEYIALSSYRNEEDTCQLSIWRWDNNKSIDDSEERENRILLVWNSLFRSKPFIDFNSLLFLTFNREFFQLSEPNSFPWFCKKNLELFHATTFDRLVIAPLGDANKRNDTKINISKQEKRKNWQRIFHLPNNIRRYILKHTSLMFWILNSVVASSSAINASSPIQQSVVPMCWITIIIIVTIRTRHIGKTKGKTPTSNIATQLTSSRRGRRRRQERCSSSSSNVSNVRLENTVVDGKPYCAAA